MPRFLTYGDKGERVKRLQRGLNSNPYKKPSPRLVVDGVMKGLTCSAVKDVKYWAGYEKDDMDPDVRDQIAGGFLFDLLEKKRPLPPEYKRRRRSRRLKRLTSSTPRRRLRLKALSIIKDEIGTMEAGGHSNVIKYNSWWGWGAVAYCVIGISWAWVKAGSTAFAKGVRWANTDAMLADAKAGRNGLHITASPVRGCPGVVDLDGTHTDPDHGITFIKNIGGGLCRTAEFNKVGSNGMEGVWYGTRRLSDCWWFGVEK